MKIEIRNEMKTGFKVKGSEFRMFREKNVEISLGLAEILTFFIATKK